MELISREKELIWCQPWTRSGGFVDGLATVYSMHKSSPPNRLLASLQRHLRYLDHGIVYSPGEMAHPLYLTLGDYVITTSVEDFTLYEDAGLTERLGRNGWPTG